MDTSKYYILMCGKAKEIQELRREWKEGDIFSRGHIDFNKICYVSCDALTSWYIRRNDDIWLPRQDQLQEMINKNNFEAYKEFELWYLNADIKQFTSLEQLWLAFVMKEKNNKLWNRKKWIKE